MLVSIIKLLLFITAAIHSYLLGAFSRIDALAVAAVVWLAAGIIVWKLDKIERILKKKVGIDDDILRK